MNVVSWAQHLVQQTIQHTIQNYHGECVSCCDRECDVLNTITSVPISCNTFKLNLFCVGTQPILPKTPKYLKRCVKLLLVAYHTPQQLQEMMEQAINSYSYDTVQNGTFINF